jgi:isopropylmalate/homocitrate/citramalate synthase
MLTRKIYPNCYHTFRKWVSNNKEYMDIYNKLGCPIPFDVTLRDGLQGLSKEEQEKYKTNKKLDMYDNIMKNHNVKNIEIGSIASEKILPIFNDTMILYDYIDLKQKWYEPYVKTNNYILVPNEKKLDNIINTNINHYSLITSVSDNFQLKNTKMNLEQSDNEIKKILCKLNEKYNNDKDKYNIKLYVSCINECPIDGKIDNDFIVNRLLKLNNMDVNIICLSDTCGSLNIEDFEYIIDTCYYFGLQFKNLSLHLHVNSNNESEVVKIIHKALDYGIINFDVSALETGGCSITIDKNKLLPNLSYNLYYKSLCDYIEKKTI